MEKWAERVSGLKTKDGRVGKEKKKREAGVRRLQQNKEKQERETQLCVPGPRDSAPPFLYYTYNMLIVNKIWDQSEAHSLPDIRQNCQRPPFHSSHHCYYYSSLFNRTADSV